MISSELFSGTQTYMKGLVGYLQILHDCLLPNPYIQNLHAISSDLFTSCVETVFIVII
jgi:hypothetical protein